jgi:hypothetical protein
MMPFGICGRNALDEECYGCKHPGHDYINPVRLDACWIDRHFESFMEKSNQ